MANEEPTRRNHEIHLKKDGWYRASVIELTGLTIEICQTCHYIVAFCNHENNSWNEDGTELTCDLCGIDGT